MVAHFEIISTNGIHLHTALAGSEDGEPVILLHGFPDAWFGWEAKMTRFYLMLVASKQQITPPYLVAPIADTYYR